MAAKIIWLCKPNFWQEKVGYIYIYIYIYIYVFVVEIYIHSNIGNTGISNNF